MNPLFLGFKSQQNLSIIIFLNSMKFSYLAAIAGTILLSANTLKINHYQTDQQTPCAEDDIQCRLDNLQIDCKAGDEKCILDFLQDIYEDYPDCEDDDDECWDNWNNQNYQDDDDSHKGGVMIEARLNQNQHKGGMVLQSRSDLNSHKSHIKDHFRKSHKGSMMLEARLNENQHKGGMMLQARQDSNSHKGGVIIQARQNTHSRKGHKQEVHHSNKQ